jgi:prepilin-type N-terminal cleavage/methylation domain-containing protein
LSALSLSNCVTEGIPLALEAGMAALALLRSPRRSGFTLIELLIVVVIIGILAAIAIPKFQSTKGKAYFASMKSDLHNLTTAQETYFYEKREYTDNLDSLRFQPSSGVVLVIDEATPTGWAATTTHPMSAPHLCRLFVGNATPIAPATEPGVVSCI